LTEILKQPLNAPVPVEEQVVAIYAGSNGSLDDIPVPAVKRFEQELIAFLRGHPSGVLEQIRDKGELPDEEVLNKAISDFKEGFDPGAGVELADEGGERSSAGASGAPAADGAAGDGSDSETSGPAGNPGGRSTGAGNGEAETERATDR
jgi:F-type H+-transporting ATPase subunit alpha